MLERPFEMRPELGDDGCGVAPNRLRVLCYGSILGMRLFRANVFASGPPGQPNLG